MKLSCIGLPDEVARDEIQVLMNRYSLESNSSKALAFPPHFSVWGDFEIKDSQVPRLKEQLQLIAANQLPLDIKLSKYGFYPWRIVYLDIEKSSALNTLHQAVMNVVVALRTAWVPQTLLDSEHFRGEQKSYIERFGYQFAGKFYSPHFTLAGNDMDEAAFQALVRDLSLKREHIDVGVAKIALVERDSGSNSIVWESN